MRLLDTTLGEAWTSLERVVRPEPLNPESLSFHSGRNVEAVNMEKMNLYFGAIKEPKATEKIAQLLLTKERSIYDEEHLLGFLSALKEQDPTGDSVIRIKIIPQLDHYFNEREGALPDMESLLRYLRALATKHLGPDFALRLDFIDPSTEPQHEQFFKVLAEAQDPYAVFQGDTNSENQSSLSIARQLFLATQTNERLRKDLQRTRPGHLKKNHQEGFQNVNGYVLAELALRIADLLKDQRGQGGMDRQERYDEILLDIMKGKKGPYARCRELQNLFKQLDPLHLDRLYYHGPNRYEGQVLRRRAATRLALQSATVAAFASGAYGMGAYTQHAEWVEKEKALEAQIVDCAKDEPFRGCESDSWCRFDKVDPSSRPKVLRKLVERGLEVMQERYAFDFSDPSQELTAKMLWVDYLCHEPSRPLTSLQTSMENTMLLPEEVDFFVTRNTAFFLGQQGLNAQRPYQELYAHLPLFQNAARATEDLKEPCGDRFKELGVYTAIVPYSRDYLVYLDSESPEPRLWVDDPYSDKCQLSTKKATEVAAYFLTDQYRFDAHTVDDWYRDGFFVDPPRESFPKVFHEGDYYVSGESRFFETPQGLHYELKRVSYYDRDSGLTGNYIVARENEKDDFSVNTAHQAYQSYMDLVLLRPIQFSSQPIGFQK